MKIHLHDSPDPLRCCACGQPCNRALVIDGQPFGYDCGVKRLGWRCTKEQAHHKLAMMRRAQIAFAVAWNDITRDKRQEAVAVSRAFGFGIAANDPMLVQKVKGLLS